MTRAGEKVNIWAVVYAFMVAQSDFSFLIGHKFSRAKSNMSGASQMIDFRVTYTTDSSQPAIANGLEKDGIS
jgi:hypothetical protein